MSAGQNVNFAKIIAIILFIILFILTIRIFSLKPYHEKYYNELINKRWEIHPISKIEIVNKNELSNDLQSIDIMGEDKINFWDGIGFKITRNTNYNYIKMSKLNNTSKLCGVDNYNNKLYVNENDDCPINYIKIDTIPPNVNFEYENIPLNNGKTLYYSNKNILFGKVLVNINVGGIYGCGICYYLNDYCVNEVNFDVCKYNVNTSSKIDSLSINDYINDNNLNFKDYEDKEIELFAETYSSLKKSFKYSNLNGLKNIKSLQMRYNFINLALLLISFIIIVVLMCLDYEYTNYCSIIFNIINLIILVIDLIILIQLLLEHKKFYRKIIPNISFPLREDYLIRKEWIELDIALILLIIIYFIANFIILFLNCCDCKYYCVLLDYSILLKCFKYLTSKLKKGDFNIFYCYKDNIEKYYQELFYKGDDDKKKKIAKFFKEIGGVPDVTRKNINYDSSEKIDPNKEKQNQIILIKNYRKILNHILELKKRIK